MADGALREDVIRALRETPEVTVDERQNGVIEVSKPGVLTRTFQLKPTVFRSLCRRFSLDYGIPMNRFFPPTNHVAKP